MKKLILLMALSISACVQTQMQWRSTVPNNSTSYATASSLCEARSRAAALRAESQYNATQQLVGNPVQGGFWGGVNNSMQRSAYGREQATATAHECMAGFGYVGERVVVK